MKRQPENSRPHRATVIFGEAAVDAYEHGIADVETLRRLGSVKSYRFKSLPELNAFLFGIEEGNGYLEAMAVESL